MNKMEGIDEKKFIFGTIFMAGNKLQTLMDRDLYDQGITSKQWFLVCVIEYLCGKNPTLNEVAKAMNSSHQNVKQVALKLQKKGFLKMEKDKNDGRILRLELTEKNFKFWNERQKHAENFLEDCFKDFKKLELIIFQEVLAKLMKNFEKMENKTEE